MQNCTFALGSFRYQDADVMTVGYDLENIRWNVTHVMTAWFHSDEIHLNFMTLWYNTSLT